MSTTHYKEFNGWDKPISWHNSTDWEQVNPIHEEGIYRQMSTTHYKEFDG